MKKVLGLAAILLMVGFTAQAAEFLTPQKGSDPNISTLAGESHRNLYVVGASVTINSDTAGDLVTAGGVVTVNGNVERDLTVGGGNINLNGTVGDDLRVGGGNISISSPVTGDLLVGGGNVTIAQKASIGGDIVGGIGNLTLDSTVGGNVKISGGNITINGQINGNLQVTATDQLTFGPASKVAGKITYKGTKQAVVKPGAQVGVIEYTKLERKGRAEGAAKAFFALGTLIRFLAMLIAGFVLYSLFPGKVSAIVAKAHDKTWVSLGVGFLVFIATPIAAIILCITVVGFYLGLILFLLYALALVLTSVFALFYTGNLVWGWYQKTAMPSLRRDLLVGTIVLLIVSIIPIIGWLICAVLFLITLGAKVLYYKENMQRM